MPKPPSRSGRRFLIVICLICWFSLIAQFYLILNSGAPVADEIIRFFSYFTILGNLLVAIYSTVLILEPSSRLARFCSRITTATAITLYIVIVGITYNVVLRGIWNPRGLQKWVDELLHLVVPLLFLLYWFIFLPKGGLKWKHAFPWMIFPLVYLIITLIRGSFTDYYPYPFIDVSTIGLSNALLHSLYISIMFFILAFIFIAIGKWEDQQTDKKAA